MPYLWHTLCDNKEPLIQEVGVCIVKRERRNRREEERKREERGKKERRKKEERKRKEVQGKARRKFS